MHVSLTGEWGCLKDKTKSCMQHAYSGIAQATVNLASVCARRDERHIATTGCPSIHGAAFDSEAPGAADSQLFFLFSHAGRGNACSVTAGFKRGEDGNGLLAVCLQNMGKESKVRMFDINNKMVHFFGLLCPLYWPPTRLSLFILLSCSIFLGGVKPAKL